MNIGCYVALIKDGKLVGIVECKAYLDKCYLERAIVDFKYLSFVTDVPKVVVALENSVAEKTSKILEHINSDKLSGIFYLCVGKRSSSKPLYKKEFFKPIDEGFYSELQTFMETL